MMNLIWTRHWPRRPGRADPVQKRGRIPGACVVGTSEPRES